MRKILLLLAAAIIMPSFAWAQTTVCGTDYFLEKQLAEDPDVREAYLNRFNRTHSHAHSAENDTLIIIPLVFHVFHKNGDGNISFAQIESAVDMLNEDFRRMNADTANTRSLFKPFAADINIEFRLAQIDPDGNCTNGVVRIDDGNAANNAGNNVKPLSYWPSDRYFNIWVVNTIESSGVPGIILGYAQFPGWGSWSTYGVVIRNDRVGTIGSATSGDRTLTHEIGHCLNLFHTFQSGCGNDCSNSGDGVCDTPPVANSTQSCDFTQNQCSNDAVGMNSAYPVDVVDQIENYMSYNDCQNMFTLGQKTRMRDVLGDESVLANLISEDNLTATGVNLPKQALCQVDFDAQTRIVCAGDSLQFTDRSYNAPTGHSWVFEGASPNTSTNQNPKVRYDVPGVYEVTLEIFDSLNNSISESKTEYIHVISPEGNTTPFVERFDQGNDPIEEDWFLGSANSTLGWEYDPNNGYSNDGCIKANAYFQNGVISASSRAYDVSNVDSVKVSFRYAYAQRSGEPTNVFKVYVSLDCGQSWQIKHYTVGQIMATAPATFGPYDSPAPDEWGFESFWVANNALNDRLRLRFELEADEGNNLFIDDINISGRYIDSTLLISPENGATDVSPNIRLNWYGTNRADYYTVWIDTDSNFSAPMSQQVTYYTSSSTGTDSEYWPSNLQHGQTYYWKVRSEKDTIINPWSETWSFTPDSTVASVNSINPDFVEIKVFPNPTNGLFNVQLETEKGSSVVVTLLDVTGHEVQTIYNGTVNGGVHVYSVNGNDLSPGVYLVQIASDSGQETRRIIIQ